MELLGLLEIKQAARAFFKDPDFKPNESIKILEPAEVNIWLSLVVAKICNDFTNENENEKGVFFKNNFSNICNDTKWSPEEKIKEVSKKFTTIISEEKDQTKKEKLIASIKITGESSLDGISEKKTEKAAEIRRILACTLITVCVTLKIVSIAIATTSLMAQVALIGLVGFTAAKTMYPEKTKEIVASVKSSSIPETLMTGIAEGITKTGDVIKQTGILEKLQAVAMSCLSNTRLITNFPKLMEDYKNLTGVELGAKSLVKLADEFQKKENPQQNKPK
jgi:hypothetical protein